MSAPPRQSSERKTHHRISGAELYEAGDREALELVRGEVVPMAPTGFRHGQVEARLAALLSSFAAEHDLGFVAVGEVGLYTRRDPVYGDRAAYHGYGMACNK